MFVVLQPHWFTPILISGRKSCSRHKEPAHGILSLVKESIRGADKRSFQAMKAIKNGLKSCKMPPTWSWRKELASTTPRIWSLNWTGAVWYYEILRYSVSGVECRAETAEDPAVPEVHPVLPGAAPPHHHRPRPSPPPLDTQLQGRKERVEHSHWSRSLQSLNTLLKLVEPSGAKV